MSTDARYVRNLGRVRFINRGGYSATTAYIPHDLVYYNACIYENIVPCTGVLPTNTGYWRMFADTRGAAYEWIEY